MMSEWRSLKLSDIAYLSSDKIEMQDVVLNNYISTDNMLPDKSGVEPAIKLPSAKRVSHFEKGDILFSNIRPYFKKVWLAEFEGGASADVLVWKPLDEELVTKEYLYYLLSSDEFIKYSVRTSKGVKMPRGDKEAMLSYELILPPIEVQRNIALLGRRLDHKISNNTAMNATLEKIAQRIFKSWFVDFDPVKANAEGVPFDGLSPEIQALFPNEFEESELGMIPKGWEVKSLDEIAHFLNGLACQKHRPKDGETPLPVIKIAEMRAGYQEKTNEASPNVDPKYIIQDGDFLFSWSGSLTTCFWSHGPGVLNQHLFKVTSEDYPKWFFSMWVNIHLAEFIRIAADKATTMGHIKREHLSQAKVVVPNLEDLMSKGNDIFGPLIERSNLCLTQAKTLMKVRDKLLPRLISGKITIQKAEELLEEAS